MTHQHWRVCESCRRTFTSVPIFREDRVYCCRSCAVRHFCTCLTEMDLADDGVDGLGLPFAIESFDRGGLVRAEAS